jgi:micrococcal nuclease
MGSRLQLTTAGLLVAITTAVSAQTSRPHSQTTARPCVVASVHDGDTMRCRDGTRVRLLLIDAPEMSQGPFARVSRDSLRKLAPIGSTVLLELDVQPTDRYRRTLAYVWTRDHRTMLNEVMARQGMVTTLVYPPNVRHVEVIRRAVDSARQMRIGLWATDGFTCSPVEHRRNRC